MRRMVLLTLLVLMACLAGCSGAGATAVAAGRQTMTFVPGDRSRPAILMIPRSERRVSVARARPPARGRIARGAQENDASPAATARPGQGFTLDNGVLTYPAPARFQPRNLKPH